MTPAPEVFPVDCTDASTGHVGCDTTRVSDAAGTGGMIFHRSGFARYR